MPGNLRLQYCEKFSQSDQSKYGDIDRKTRNNLAGTYLSLTVALTGKGSLLITRCTIGRSLSLNQHTTISPHPNNLVSVPEEKKVTSMECRFHRFRDHDDDWGRRVSDYTERFP